jgi:hypothetical protein
VNRITGAISAGLMADTTSSEVKNALDVSPVVFIGLPGTSAMLSRC